MEKTLLVIEPMLKDMSNKELMEVKNAELHHSTNEKWGKRWNKKVDTLDAYGEMETLVGMIDEEISLRKASMELPKIVTEIEQNNEAVVKVRNKKEGIDYLMKLTDELDIFPMPFTVRVPIYTTFSGADIIGYELHFMKAKSIDDTFVLKNTLYHKDVKDSEELQHTLFTYWFE